MIKIINPYADVNFASTPRVPAISHEHIFNDFMMQNAYRRGIRIFACVDYYPSAPSVCPQGKLGTTKDQKFSSWKIPITDWATTNVPDDWYTKTLAELSPYLTTRYWEGSYPTITDVDGNTINTDSLPQIANAEWAFNRWNKDNINDREKMHHNVLGNLFPNATNGIITNNVYKSLFAGMTWNEEKSWRQTHQLYSMHELTEKYLSPSYQQFDGKIFGTVNHHYDVSDIERYFKYHSKVYKAMELFNQGFSVLRNQAFRDAYDEILKKGYRVWGTSVADWQGEREAFSSLGMMPDEWADWNNRFNALSDAEKALYGSAKSFYEATYTKDCGDKDRGCNVLYIDNYSSLLTSDPQSVASVALDAYSNGRYFMSAWGGYYPTNINATTSSASITLNGSATKLRAITNLGVTESSGSSISIPVGKGVTYVRFEAYFADKDFVFTNPIFYDRGDKNNIKRDSIILNMV